MDFSPILLSLELAFISTLILLFLCIPTAYLLTYKRFKLKFLIKTFISMPLVLPPTVLGFYFLILFSPESWLGYFLLHFLNLQLIFSFEGLVVASLFFNLPFMLNPLQSGFENFPQQLKEVAYSLGKTELQTLWYVVLPNLRSSVWIAVSMTFAHTIGEFGLVLMIGGNIPDETRLASIAIYEEVELLHYGKANLYAGILFLISFVILLLSNIIEHQNESKIQPR